MKVIWLGPPDSKTSKTVRHDQIAFWDSAIPMKPEDVQDSLALIIEIASSLHAEHAADLIQNFRHILPIWIFDPLATVADSVRWMKAGAVHVAATLDGVSDSLESLRPCHSSEARRVKYCCWATAFPSAPLNRMSDWSRTADAMFSSRVRREREKRSLGARSTPAVSEAAVRG